MEKRNTEEAGSDRAKLVAALAVVLLGGSIGWHVMRGFADEDTQKMLNSALADRSRAETELKQVGQQLAFAQVRVGAIEAEVHQQETERIAAEQQLEESQRRIHALDGAQASAVKWKQQVDDLKAEQVAGQQRLADMLALVDRLNAAKLALEQSNAALKDEADRMAANNAFMNGSLTQAFRGKKERVTVLARKARKLQVSMVLPGSAAKNASYLITSPNGEVIHQDSPGMSIITQPTPGERTAALGKGVAIEGGEQVKLVYIPKRKLEPGMYKVEVRSGDRSLGITFLNLR